MAVFNKSNSNSETTIISSKAIIEGSLRLKSNLHIDGEIKGKILSDAIVSIGKNGKAEGEVFAKKLIVSGKFIGKADCEGIEILKTGVFTGEIIVEKLFIEEGAIFEGTCKKRNKKN